MNNFTISLVFGELKLLKNLPEFQQSIQDLIGVQVL